MGAGQRPMATRIKVNGDGEFNSNPRRFIAVSVSVPPGGCVASHLHKLMEELGTGFFFFFCIDTIISEIGLVGFDWPAPSENDDAALKSPGAAHLHTAHRHP